MQFSKLLKAEVLVQDGDVVNVQFTSGELIHADDVKQY